VLDLLDDPDMGGKLGDLRVLTVGFLELSARAAAPPLPPVEPNPNSPASVTAPPAATGPSAAPSAQGPISGKIYTAEDEAVRPPVVVRQEIPSVPQNMMSMVKPRGLVEVVIDEQGRVVAMAMRQSLHPGYDALILNAARDWKYQPARYGGQPVRFRRLISVAVRR
jgi:hypothetical protein